MRAKIAPLPKPAQRIIRSKAEWHCLQRSAAGHDLTFAEIVATITDATELKGYMLALHKSNRLDDDARSAIQSRLSELETVYGRKYS